MRQRLKPLGAFWSKINNDWIFNLSGLLAFNFLMATVPLLLVLLAIVGFVIGNISASGKTAFTHGLATAFPISNAQEVITAATTQLSKSVGVLLLFGIITSIFLGSRLFIVIENCFGIIFRLRGRDLGPQNAMAFGMLFLYIVLTPVFFVASVVQASVLTALKPIGFGGVLTQISTDIGLLFIASILFGFIYLIVPNRRPTWHHLWPGTVVAGFLLVIYEKIFPLYTAVFLKPGNYGPTSSLGFAVVILIFYNYLAFILLLGAEVNSWASGQRETSGDLQAMVHDAESQQAMIGAMLPIIAAQRAAAEEHANEKAVATAQAPTTHREVLRTQRRGKTIVAGQFATLGLLSGALATWALGRVRGRAKSPDASPPKVG